MLYSNLVMSMKKYYGAHLKECIRINELFTVHYFEFSKNYKFHGESHDFWEFVYVDKGEIIVTVDDESFALSGGQIFFHKPNQWHRHESNGEIAPNIVIVSFACSSPAMSFFENKLLSVGQTQKSLISKIISEFTNSFLTPVNAHTTTTLERNAESLVGSEQLIKMYLSELLILFMRDNDVGQYSMSKSNRLNSNLEFILSHMNANVSRMMTLADICSYSGMSKSAVSALFSTSLGMGPIDYFIKMKIDLAKKYIREDNYNITQIAEMLGYSSIHYFSRQFKKTTGMSPSQYSNSIKALDKN